MSSDYTDTAAPCELRLTAQTGTSDKPTSPSSPAAVTSDTAINMLASKTGNTPSSYSASRGRVHTPRNSVYPTPMTATPLPVPGAASQDPATPQVIKLSRSKGGQILDRLYTKNPDGLYFHSVTSAFAAMTMSSWQSPANDKTIPKNAEEDREVVRHLVDAFMDLQGALDTADNAYRKRFTPGSTVFYKPWTVERCAWDILNKVKSMHLWGFTSPITDVDILKTIGQTENWTFEERISMICRVLKLSKSVAVSLMKQEKVWTVIGAPHKLLHSSVVNNKSNGDRNEWVKSGRAAAKVKKRKTLHEATPPPSVSLNEEDVNAADILMGLSFSKV